MKRLTLIAAILTLAILSGCRDGGNGWLLYFAEPCIDADLDGYSSGGCNFNRQAGPDCDDTDPDNWNACETCADADGDGYFGGCDAYTTIAGPDCSDSNTDNWNSCAACADGDGDSYFAGCDRYSTILGPDCDDNDDEKLLACGPCHDDDGDGFYLECDVYSTYPGPDCDDTDLNNWDSCATCKDTDGDQWFAGCDAYLSILGVDCSDADPDNWVKCSSCLDGDGDGFYVGCDRYLDKPGPDRLDSDVDYSSYFTITAEKPPAGWTPTLHTDGGTDTSAVPYRSVSARWVNPSLQLTNIALSADGDTVSFTIHSTAASRVDRIWMFAWVSGGSLASAPRLVNAAGDNVFIIGPIEPGADIPFALAIAGFTDADGYQLHLDFISIAERIAFGSDRLAPIETWESEIFSGDSMGGDLSQVTSDPDAIYADAPIWSAAGEWVAYLSGSFVTCTYGSTITTSIRPHVYMVHPDGSNRRKVSEGSLLSGNMTFNPQGTVIAYECRSDCSKSDTGICTYNIRTGVRKEIFSGAGYRFNQIGIPRWSPNGQYMVMMGKDSGQFEKWLYAHVNPETGDPLESPINFTSSNATTLNEYNFSNWILDWEWAPDSTHAVVTLYRYLCWCKAGAAASKGVDCYNPGRDPTCNWAYYSGLSSSLVFPQADAMRGIGIFNFQDALNATSLPVGLGFNRLGRKLAWKESMPRYLPVSGYINEDANRIYFTQQGSTLDTSNIKYYKLSSGYVWDGSTVQFLLPKAERHYELSPVTFPSIQASFFPIRP